MIILTEKIMGEIYLAPEEEKIKNAAEIAAVSESMEKFIFTVFYALSDKEVILSELKRIGVVIVNHTDKDSAVTVKMSMEQLAAIKTLECVERVEMPEQNKVQTINMKDSMEATPMVVSQFSNENEISLLCYGDGGSSGSDCSNDISTAIYLPLSTWKSGSVHCPYAEMWYRFTASVSNASQYRIYTTGSLDTMGYLYDANGSYITQNDDNGGLNFSITRSLTYGATYYICVRAYGSNTGNFSLRVDYTTSSSSGNNNNNNNDDCSNDMSTAITLPLSTYVSGSIECPCAEKWYRFTASNSNASQYTIYTSGSLDTVGYLYNSNGTLITSNDDSGANMNFSITRALTYGATYYLKVKAYGSNTGSFNVRVDYETPSAEPDDNDCSNEMASAINLSLNSWQSGEICCPGAEIWYKFIPSTTAYYTIYTVGSLDTYGYLYDANGTEIDHDDDDGSGLNFKIVQRLTANQTYYIKAKAFGNNTGYFSIAVTSTVFVESVSINQSYVYLDKGKTANLTATVTPSNATNPTLRWETGDASVATVNQDGVVTARGAGSTCISAYSQDGSNKISCCEVEVNVPVEIVTINTSSLLMRVGEHDDLDAEICPTDAVNKLIRWSSTNTGVAWVNEATGRVEARGVGSATIYATAQDGTGVRGSCTVQVKAPIAVQGIDICCSNYTMNVGETTKLSYDIYPADATNKGVTWCSSNPNVADFNASIGRITAKSAGTTTITVTTNDGGFVASCLLKVIIDTVTVQKDGAFNKVVFSKSGKVWRCINNDMIFDENNRNNTLLIRRSNHNFFTYYNESDPFMSNTTPKEYTDDEIKLLYAIDPYGVAYYVKRYASEQFYDNELEGVLGYKDRIFRLLFNKEPRYFAQAYNGEWYVTDDKTDLNNVISESESYFGMHSTYDFLRALVSAIDFATAVLCTIIPNEAADTIVEVGGTLLKVGILYHNEEYQMAFEEVLSLAGDVIFDPQDELIETVFEVFSVFTSFNELINSIATKPRYYCDILDYCINKVNYNVILELENGDKMKIKDIKESIA